MTAREFLKDTYKKNNKEYDSYEIQLPSVEEDLIEFAKFHVKAALEAASKKGLVIVHDYDENKDWTTNHYLYGENNVKVDEESILKAYPEENIK